MPVHMLNQYCKAACLPVTLNSAPSAGPDDDPNRSAEFGIQRNRGRKVDVTFALTYECTAPSEANSALTRPGDGG